MAEISASPGGAPDLRAEYIALVQRKRLYGGLTLGLFVIAMVIGFDVVDARSAGVSGTVSIASSTFLQE